MKLYLVQDREAGNVIVNHCTLAEAENYVKEFEDMDKAEGSYIPDFYEIKEMETEEEN